MSRVQKEHCKAQDQCSKLQRDLRENVAQKEDQVERSRRYNRSTEYMTYITLSGGAHNYARETLFECST